MKKGKALATCAQVTSINRRDQLTTADSSNVLKNELRQSKMMNKGVLQRN